MIFIFQIYTSIFSLLPSPLPHPHTHWWVQEDLPIHNQAILEHQQGVQEFRSASIYLETAPDPELKDSVLQDCPPLHTPDPSHKPQAYPGLLIN